MRVSSHIALSVVVAGACYFGTKSPEIATVSFFSGWLVDIDHVIDLVRERTHDFMNTKKKTVLLHSWELFFALFISSLITHSPLIAWIEIAFFLHITIDQIVYRPQPFWYSLIWRAKHGFDSKYSGHINTISTLTGLLIVDTLYLIAYATILSTYRVVIAPPSVGWQVARALQWFIPVVLFLFVTTFAIRLLKPVINIKLWTSVGLVIVALLIALQLSGARGVGGSWSSLGLCMLILMTVTNAVESKLGNVKAAILGLEVMFLSIATFEIVYQIGLVYYHNFFGESMINFFTVICMNLAWIIPCAIMLLLWRDKHLFHWNKYSTICLAIAIIATAVWFGTKMTIPLMYYGIKGPFDAHPNPIQMGFSRAAQGFVCASIVCCFIPFKKLTHATN